MPVLTEDYKFGFTHRSPVMGLYCIQCPNYLIVKAAGNSHGENGPAVGQPYWRFNSSGTMVSSGNEPAGISNNDSYDIISTYGTSKSILTIERHQPYTWRAIQVLQMQYC